MRPAVPLLCGMALATSANAQPVDYSSYVPSTELYTMTEQPPDTALVQRLFTLAFTEPCNSAIDGGYGGPEPQVYDFTYRGTYDEPTDPERAFRLYRFNCNGGAYNFSSVFYGWDEMSGLEPISFAAPTFKPTYEGEDVNPDGILVKLELTGMSADLLVVNAEVDETTGIISATGYWRGIGDASNSGTWRLVDGEYVLETFDIDASYDGEVNPVRVYDQSAPEDVELPG